ncbi:hypothetical protein [Kordiimonas gwangyangensis]|uniref:hypothetical protein n=1 Tax=Kordiimonas gwangyangensis TaxID=288022 RepID=UPI0012DE9A8F|nr:hypothetical protein [Kordiimonas gwangyangensis]
MTGVITIPQAALMALLKHANTSTARLPDVPGRGQFQHELLSFQRATTSAPQMNTQLVSSMRPSVFIPEIQGAGACAPTTTPKRGEAKKKDKPTSGSGGARQAAPRR